MNIKLDITFLLKSYESKAITAFLKAGFKVSKPVNVEPNENLPSYPSSLTLENTLPISEENTNKTIKEIKELLASTKYFSIFYFDGRWQHVSCSNISLERKPKIKREVPYLKVLKSETKEEKLEN